MKELLIKLGFVNKSGIEWEKNYENGSKISISDFRFPDGGYSFTVVNSKGIRRNGIIKDGLEEFDRLLDKGYYKLW